jgi:hypothetical protein
MLPSISSSQQAVTINAESSSEVKGKAIAIKIKYLERQGVSCPNLLI